MSEPSRPFKLGSIVWAIAIAIGIIALAGSLILPSTKRARIDLDELRHRSEENDAAPATTAATVDVLPSTH